MGEKMALFQSKEEKAAKRAMAIRMARKKVEAYVRDSRGMAEKYTGLARRALALEQQGHCDRYLMYSMQYEQQARKWDAFLLQMEDLSMRGRMSGAISSLMGGIQSLTREIKAGMSVKDMGRMITELNLSIEQLQKTEEQVAVAMETFNYGAVSPVDESAAEISPEFEESIRVAREQLVEDLVDGTKSQQEMVADGADSELEQRIKASRKALEALKNM